MLLRQLKLSNNSQKSTRHITMINNKHYQQYHTVSSLFAAVRRSPTSAPKSNKIPPPLAFEPPKPAPHTVYKRRIRESLTVTAPVTAAESFLQQNSSFHTNAPFNNNKYNANNNKSSSSYIARNQRALELIQEKELQQQQQSLSLSSTTTEEKENESFFVKHFSKQYPQVIECLKKEFKIENPSTIQQLVMPELLKGNDVLCAAQTGTGKTLSYVLPLLIRMKNDESSVESRLKRPKIIILVPSRELASQVASIVKKFAHYLKFRCVCLRSDLENVRMKRDLNTKVDVVVSTPGVFIKLHDKGALHYTDIRHVVVDEADTLLSKDFKQELTEHILVPCRDREIHNEKQLQRVQFCFALATYNSEIQNYMAEYFPRMKLLATPKLHHNHKNITQKFITVPGHDKIKHLLPLIQGETSENRTIVFCGTVNSCRAVHYALKEAGIFAACYHSEIPAEKQAEEYESFSKGETHIMVCTDLASRGLDIASVRHVVMFDFPLNTVDYLHRVGRTGRFGAPGRVTSLVNRPREIALAKEIEKRIQSNTSLEGVSSNPKDFVRTTNQAKKGSALSSQKQAQKGKRALYWERQKLKEKLKVTKLQSRIGNKQGPRRVRPVGAKGSFDLALDAISIPNPSPQ